MATNSRIPYVEIIRHGEVFFHFSVFGASSVAS